MWKEIADGLMIDRFRLYASSYLYFVVESLMRWSNHLTRESGGEVHVILHLLVVKSSHNL